MGEPPAKQKPRPDLVLRRAHGWVRIRPRRPLAKDARAGRKSALEELKDSLKECPDCPVEYPEASINKPCKRRGLYLRQVVQYLLNFRESTCVRKRLLCCNIGEWP